MRLPATTNMMAHGRSEAGSAPGMRPYGAKLFLRQPDGRQYLRFSLAAWLTRSARAERNARMMSGVGRKHRLASMSAYLPGAERPAGMACYMCMTGHYSRRPTSASIYHRRHHLSISASISMKGRGVAIFILLMMNNIGDAVNRQMRNQSPAARAR